MRRYLLGTAAFFLIVTLLIIGGEISIRIYQYVKDPNSPITFDDELGWKPTVNYSFEGYNHDASGAKYPVTVHTNRDGFRMFGDPKVTNRRKVLFLGDSYTHAVPVSDDRTYYRLLRESLDIEVFAFGGLGFSTLQEYMILDKFVDEIDPDVIILQFCDNDFINNQYELERRSNVHNNGMLRPYLTDNGIRYMLPREAPLLREIANKHSRFLYLIISRIDRLRSVYMPSVEEDIRDKKTEYFYFRKAVDTTDKIIKLFKSRISVKTKFYVFSVDSIDPYDLQLRRILDENGIPFIAGIPEALNSAERKGTTTRTADNYHWNEMGHKIAANVLKEFLEQGM